MAFRSQVTAFYVGASVFALLAGYTLCRWIRPYRPAPVPWKMAGEWVTSPDPDGAVGYYRKTLSLASGVSNAWLAIAACDTFELIVNGRVMGGQSPWRPNRSFQFAMSERGQRMSSAKSIPGVSYARDFQWGSYANYRLPVFFDLSRALHPGKNVICIRVESRAAPNRLCVGGGILLESGHEVALKSDRSWKGAGLPRREASMDWVDVEYSDLAWSAAQGIASPGESLWTFDPDIFSLPFRGSWLSASDETTHRSIWFETTWNLEQRPKDAWIRLATNRAYDLYINGHKAEPPSDGASELSAGNWIIHTATQRRGPQMLDPDVTGTLFAERDTDADSSLETTGDTVGPIALLQDRQVGAFDAYSVGAMLKAGENKISVRLIARDPTLKWRPQMALDGRAMDGIRRSDLVSSAATWKALEGGTLADTKDVTIIEAGRPGGGGVVLPRKRYLGYCYFGGDKLREWMFLGGLVVLLVVGMARGLLKHSVGLARGRFLAESSACLSIASTILACAIILDCCFAVRDEILWMLPGETWGWILALSVVSGVLTGAVLRWGRRFEVRPKHLSLVVLGALVFACGFTRSYRLEFQPTDADEWASVQTILGIVDTGTPKLIDDVFYTRSPLYHYLTAASVLCFGKNFWALRLPGALFAMGTCALIYLCGARLLKSRWIGLGAAALFTIHPLALCMGHQVRFYQQQQFFALLTVYYFCLGFVSGQRMKYRYLALAAFFAAIFSQEISVMLAFTLIANYLLFAEARSWRTEARWLICAGCGLVLVILDFVIFQTVCLTQVEGVSPRVEPALKLNLMYPSSFYWIFSLFSRLHFGLSAVFLVGLPFALRSWNRNVLALYLTFFSGIVFSTILISGSGVRFQYWLFPIFFLLAVHGARELATFVFAPGRIDLQGRHRMLGGVMATLLVTTIGLSWSPWKIPGSYSTKILPDVDRAFAYVRENIAPEDALAVVAPHTAAAICEVGRVDFDIEVPLFHDFVYRKNGRLIDRNAGAEVISKLDELQDACARHRRLWVVLNRDIRFRSPGENIAWQDPGGRFDLFVRTNFELKYQTNQADVFLWDDSNGRLKTFRRSL